MLRLIDLISKPLPHRTDVAGVFDVLVFVGAVQVNSCADPVPPTAVAQCDLDVIHSDL